jgi:uncharacterized protein (DUF1330 family)
VRESTNGVAEDSAMVVVEFETFEKAKAFDNSDGYQAAIKLRSETTLVLVAFR